MNTNNNNPKIIDLRIHEDSRNAISDSAKIISKYIPELEGNQWMIANFDEREEMFFGHRSNETKWLNYTSNYEGNTVIKIPILDKLVNLKKNI